MKKLIAIYNLWDGEELLEGSIKCIRPYVDEIIVIVQEQSNWGVTDQSGLIACIDLLSRAKIDAYYIYEPSLLLSAQDNEKLKRNFGLEKAKRLGATHYILMDVDEYYDSTDFAIAKIVVVENDYDSTFCKVQTYFKKPTWQISPIGTLYVPFICKLRADTQVGFYELPMEVDPTRQPNYFGIPYLFKQDELVMDHYSHVRKNYERKLANSSARVNWMDYSDLLKRYNEFKIGNRIPFYDNSEIIEVENKFGITI